MRQLIRNCILVYVFSTAHYVLYGYQLSQQTVESQQRCAA